MLTGEIAEGGFDDGAMPALADASADGFGDDSFLPALGSGELEDPVERLRGLIGERQEETVEILRSWLEGEEESA